MTSSLRLIPLGGLGEIGMNCMALETAGHLVVLDCGVTFGHRMFGVGVIHPDFKYLRAKAEQCRAIVITHAHEDHLGAVSFLRQDLQVPIYGPAYALALLKRKLADAGHPTCDLRELRHRDPVQIGDLRFETFPVTHSIPDSCGLIIDTPAGRVVHSGDFKIDRDAPEGERFDFDRLRSAGDDGVRLLMSDSTNVFREGRTGGEASVERALEALVEGAENRVVIAQFSSNVYRMRSVLELAGRVGRRVCILGRSALMHYEIGWKQGIIRPIPHGVISAAEAREVPRHKLLVIATGTQGEPGAALGRLARNEHRDMSLEAGDEVVLSSRIIPGLELDVFEMIGQLERRDILVHHRALTPEVHVSGHACRDEQAELMRLVRPQAFLPVHGTISHLKHHAMLAEQCGITQIVVAENGDVIELTPQSFEVVDQIQTGRVHRRGRRMLPPEVLRDRQLMAELGLVIVALPIRDDHLMGMPAVYARGVVVLDGAEELLREASDWLDEDIADEEGRLRDDDPQELIDRARRSIRRFFHRRVGYRPLVSVMLVPVE